jgi:hypothetical protein
METHIWHAKRFAMEDLWGFRVPYKSRDKSCRTVYKLSQRDSACILDQSYMRTLSFTGPSYLAACELLSISPTSSILQRLNLHTDDSTLLCPLDALALPHQQELLLFIHPAAYLPLLAHLAALSLPTQERHLNSFTLIS